MARKSENARYIVFHRLNRFGSDGVYWEAHGFKFKEGTVYPVSELVYQWAKTQKNFFEIKEISEKFVDFK